MLTDAQIITLRADIQATPELAALAAQGAIGPIVTLYNTAASPAFVVWRSDTPVSELFEAITWANMTPVDTPDGTMLWMNRNLQCQSKQINLQTMMVGRDSLRTSKASVRSGLQDALTNLPSGAGGTALDAGWLGAGKVRLTIQRQALRGEKLFATGTGNQTTPADLTFEGNITDVDVEKAVRG